MCFLINDSFKGLKRTNVILTFFDLNDEEIHTEVKDAVESIIADDVEPLIVSHLDKICSFLFIYGMYRKKV